ncbi:hypothetical protein H1P_310009 [Hyella patelloides LEGE 07179]|uniref:Uncharacterized protein n=1 Tax=Hyella patelloides LEGE 07179 TaxID=945734 RepID=A0A563VUM7_9CYAN|nr:hypothetical protein H1P_310009 [Hyella patelloides LEGE 07179]
MFSWWLVVARCYLITYLLLTYYLLPFTFPSPLSSLANITLPHSEFLVL